MPRVSVWLTSYNHEKFIAESIESILAQTYTDYELFIIDDCSSDGSWNIIQQYAKKDARIKAIRHSYNQGQSGLQDMLTELSGEYVAIAHCDDKWLPDKLEKQVEILNSNHNVAACFTLADVIRDDGNELRDEKHVYYGIFNQPNRTRYEWLNYFYYNGNCLCHPSLLIRKNAYTEMNIITKGLHGLPDLCQWIRLCKKADIYVLQERLTKFRVHGDGSNTSGDNVKNVVRVNTEEWLLLTEFVSLIDTHEITKVFPETTQYIVDGKICEKYALAQVMLGHPMNSHKLFGLQLLYELFQNPIQEQEIGRLYGYTRKMYNSDKQKYDIFRVIPENRRLHINVYFNGENGYSEEQKISMNSFVQQTGAFSVKVDLNDYSGELLENIRVDLDEGKYRKFKLCNCKCAGENVEHTPLNGICEDGWDAFYTTDPQYRFSVTKSGILHIEGYTEEILSSQVERVYNDTLNRCRELEEEISRMEDTISRMENTKVWILRNKILKLLGR